MRTTAITNNTPFKSSFLKSLIVVLFLATAPVFAEDRSDIDILRKMGKAFASIAEKASPAVVGLRSERSVTQQSPLL